MAFYWHQTVGKRGHSVAVRQRGKRRNIELYWWVDSAGRIAPRHSDTAIASAPSAKRRSWQESCWQAERARRNRHGSPTPAGLLRPVLPLEEGRTTQRG